MAGRFERVDLLTHMTDEDWAVVLEVFAAARSPRLRRLRLSIFSTVIAYDRFAA
jgi:hypothetical protein